MSVGGKLQFNRNFTEGTDLKKGWVKYDTQGIRHEMRNTHGGKSGNIYLSSKPGKTPIQLR